MLQVAVAKRVIARHRDKNRFISVGTNLLNDSSVTLQAARPWRSSNEGSNKAVDNAKTMSNIFAGKKIAVFGVPAPFTGTCTNEHYPPYQRLAGDFKKAGVDELICYAVSDPYAHYAWAVTLNNNFDQITFLADPTAEFAHAYGLDQVYDESSLGLRSKRFSMLVENGVVKSFHLVENASKDAEVLLKEAKKP
jgi:peroxiredoxin